MRYFDESKEREEFTRTKQNFKKAPINLFCFIRLSGILNSLFKLLYNI